MQEQANLQEREKAINEMKEINEELNNKLNNLNNETEIEYINSCEYDKYLTYNHCDICQRNFNSPCDCYGNLLGRCTNFPWTIIDDKRCDECHCLNDRYKIDSYHWI